MRNRKKKSWIAQVYDENKLYIWVVIGVLIISGVTIGVAVGNVNKTKIVPNNDLTYIQEENNNTTETNTTPVKENNSNSEKDNNTSKNTTNKSVESKTNKTVNTSTKKTETENNNEEVIKKQELKFIMPLDGQITKNFSENTLVYSNTLEEWVNHTGVDIEADRAMPVKAIESGTVIGVKQDPRYGYTIIIDHGQGYKSIYCNLTTLDMVYEGKTVEKGQVISGVGDTALFEVKDNPHLHLEIMYNDEYINPLEIIKQ